MMSEIHKDELKLRIARIQEKMAGAGTDALLICDNANLFYVSGYVFRGYAYIPVKGDALYFVIRPVGMDADGFIYVRKPENIPDELCRLGLPLPSRIGLELDQIPYSEICRLSSLFPEAEVGNCSSLMRGCRMIKTDWEIKEMKIDGIHQSTAYSRIKHVYKEDMRDLELQIEIERVLRLEGCLGYARKYGRLMEINMGSVLCGANADAPTPYDFAVGGMGVNTSLPVGANGTILRQGMCVMVDMNGCFNGYQTDMTRVWRIGDIPELAYRAHECSRRILRTLEREGRPGVMLKTLYEMAMSIVSEEGLDEYFMGHRQKAAFIGHGVGIELNEPPVITPRSKDILEENMTIAIEPKFVIPQVGAVGVENTYVVRSGGLECITDFPEDIAEL